MTAQEILQADPGLASAFQQHRLGSPGATPDSFLSLWASRNPTNPRIQQLAQSGYNFLSPAEATATERALANGGNTQVVQGGNQTGAFNSQGTSGSTQTQTQDQTGRQTGITSTGTTGTTNTTGTNTTGVNDTLGFGALLQGQAGGAQAADAARSGFLMDLVNTGGQQFNNQVSEAANYALSGPGMQGVGNAAQGRVAGSAIGNVARNNLGQRLQASQQLAGPTAVQQLVTAGNPYLGQTQTQTGQQTQQGTQTGYSQSDTTQQNVGVTDLVSNEQQSGTTNAATSQFGVGNQPQGSGGGCYVSSVIAIQDGRMPLRALRYAVRSKLYNPRHRKMCLGYSVYGPALASLVLRYSWLRRVMRPVCRAIIHEELRWAGRSRGSTLGAVYHSIFHWGSTVVGALSGRKSVVTKNQKIVDLLKSHNLFFNDVRN